MSGKWELFMLRLCGTGLLFFVLVFCLCGHDVSWLVIPGAALFMARELLWGLAVMLGYPSARRERYQIMKGYR